MILPVSFENSWIQQISKTIGKRGDPKLIEKIIYAFALLEQLKLSGLDLIFKGGTSVFLMSDPPSRFSIDVDIIVNFIIGTFRIEEAIICASKVAYITQILKQEIIADIARFSSAADIAALTISQPEFTKLNRLKNTSPEAFFYWYHALKLF